MPNTARQSLVIKPVSQLAAFAQRLFQAPQNNIEGMEPNAWYSPLNPVVPMGSADEEPKGFQFYAGQNLIWTPRPDAEYNAFELKGLATYPLARICIENVKDSISRIPWTCQLRPLPGESKKDIAARSKGNKDLLAMQRFFDKPDRENCWDDWLRPLVEDMLVIDAATVLVRRTLKGEVAELRVLPGEMITRYIDDNGYTPRPPSPAYAQIWWGVPLLNLTTDQLIYKPRNIVRRGTVSSQLYGMSPTEQLAPEIVPGIKRLEFVTLYYTAGAIPDVVQVVPKGTPAGQIAEAMQWMNSELAGNLSERRKWRMVQGFAEDGKTDQILFPKEKLLADAFDEMHIRKICFGYGTSPQRLMRMMGSRNAAAQQEAAEVEGLIPWLEWIKNYRNHITQNVFGYTEIESSYDAEREPDPEKQANRLKTLVSCGIMTINRAADELGDEPYKIPEADQPGIVTGTGFVPIAAEDKLAHQQTLGTDAESQHQRGMESRAAAAANKPQGEDDGDNKSSKPTSAVSKPNGKPNGKAHGGGPTATQHGSFGFAAVLDEPNTGIDDSVVGHASSVSALEKEFNPDQERDEHGRWTSGGGSGESAKEDAPKKVELLGHEIETSIKLYKDGKTTGEIAKHLGKEANRDTRGAIRDALRQAGVYKERGGLKPEGDKPVGGEGEKPTEGEKPAASPRDAALAAMKDRFRDSTGSKDEATLKIPQVRDGMTRMAEFGLSAEVINTAPRVRITETLWGGYANKSNTTGLYGQDHYGADSRIGLRTTPVGSSWNPRADTDTFVHEYGHHLTLQDYRLMNNLNWNHKEYHAAKQAMLDEFSVARGPANRYAEQHGFRVEEKPFSVPDHISKNAISAYSLANDREWRAEGFMKYMKGGSSQERLRERFPATFDYMNKLATNGFSKE